MDREALIPKDGPPDIRAIHRFAVTKVAAARRQGDARTARRWRRLVARCLRALRFAARIDAGCARGDSDYSHSFFSETPENVFEPLTPTCPTHPDRRRAFREGRRRR